MSASIVFFAYSIVHLPLEKPQTGKDYRHFAHEIKNFRNLYGLDGVPFMQVFSHPVYNADTLIWLWHINMEGSSIKLKKSRIKDVHKLLHPESAELIANKLSSIPFLIISERNAIEIGGEPFHTLNRLHTEINKAIVDNQQFIRMKTISVDNGSFPVHFYLNRNFELVKPIKPTADGWTEWGGEVDFFSLRAVRLKWTGVPIQHIENFTLVPVDNGEKISFQLSKVLPDGRYEYKSDKIDPPGKKSIYTIMVASKYAVSASAKDSRKLAFLNVRAEILSSD